MLSLEGHGQGGGPAFAGIQNGGGRLFVPAAAAVLGAGQALPGLDAHELGHAGLGPDQSIGEFPDVAHNASSGAHFVDAQSLGPQICHAVAVVGEELLVNGDGSDVAAQIVVVVLDQTRGQAV